MSEKGKVFIHSKDANGRKIIITDSETKSEISEVKVTQLAQNGGKIFTHQKRGIELKFNSSTNMIESVASSEVIIEEINHDKIVYDDKIVYNSNTEIPYVIHTKKTAKKQINEEKIPDIQDSTVKSESENGVLHTTLAPLRKKFLNNPLMIINDIFNDITNFEQFQIIPLFSNFNILEGENKLTFSQGRLTFFTKKPKAVIYLINTLLSIADCLEEEDIMKSLTLTFAQDLSVDEWLYSLQDYLNKKLLASTQN